jgi:hypothetical protein
MRDCIRRVLGYVPTNVGGARPYGLVQCSMSYEGRLCVERDLSGTQEDLLRPDNRLRVRLFDAYNEGVDYLVVEGSDPTKDPITAFDTMAGELYGLMLEELGVDDRPEHKPFTLATKSTGDSKSDNIKIVASLYEREQIWHVGEDLDTLARDMLGDWNEGVGLIPASVRALTIAILELVGVDTMPGILSPEATGALRTAAAMLTGSEDNHPLLHKPPTKN